MSRLLVLIVALIVYGSLYPWHFQFGPAPHDPLLFLLNTGFPVWDRFAVRDAAVNLLLYLPLGAAAFWALGRVPRGPRAVLVLMGGTLLSAAMEMLQIYVPGRTCSLADVVFNAAGTAVGIGAALAIHPFADGRRALLPAGPTLLLGGFALGQVYPFFPIFSQTVLRQALARMAAEPFSMLETYCAAAEWLAALVCLLFLVRAVFGRGARSWLVVAPLCLPLRLFVPGRTLAAHDVIGAGLAFVMFLLLAERQQLRAAAWLLAVAIVVRELAPFHFSASPAAFAWKPFGASLDSDTGPAIAILARKAFEYGGLVWFLVRGGASYFRAGTAVAGALLALEFVQRFLPGRTPESTDAVLTAILAVTLWSLENFQRAEGLG